MTDPFPPSRLVGSNGQLLGRQPVVAHVITVPAGMDPHAIANLAQYWQQTMGVPAIVVAAGVDLIGHVLADGTLEALPLNPALSAKVQEVLVERGQLRDAADRMEAAGITPTEDGATEVGTFLMEADDGG